MLVRTEGQRLLLAVPGTLAAIAATAGCRSRQSVSEWRKGTKLPGPEARARLEAAFGIPVPAWDCLHVDAARVAAQGAPPAPTAAPTTLEDLLTLQAQVRRKRAVAGLQVAAEARLIDSEVKVLSLRAKLEQDRDMLEERIVLEHPSWHRLRRALVAALVPHPVVARAVADELARLGVA